MNALMVINWILTLITPVIPDNLMDTVIEMFNTLTTYVVNMEEELHGKTNSLREQAKWLEDERENSRILGLANERAEQQIERLHDKLHDEKVACSKAHDDLAKLAKMLMNNTSKFEQMIADIRLSEPQGYASKILQICWDNDPKDRGSRNARPGELVAYMHQCIKKHRSIDDNQ